MEETAKEGQPKRKSMRQLVIEDNSTMIHCEKCEEDTFIYHVFLLTFILAIASSV